MENMIGDVAQAIQRDRRAQAARNERIAEAVHGRGPAARGDRMRIYRATIAQALLALAARLAPPMPDEATQPGMATSMPQ